MGDRKVRRCALSVRGVPRLAQGQGGFSELGCVTVMPAIGGIADIDLGRSDPGSEDRP